MSQENVEVVEQMIALFHAGDAEGALACFSPDVVADASRRPDGGIEISQHYATIYELRGSEIASMTLYPDPEKALEAAGLRE